MISIIINGKPTQVNAPVPREIKRLEVTFPPNLIVQIPKSQEIVVKRWLNKVIDACTCEWVSYNKVLTRVEDCKKFEDV